MDRTFTNDVNMVEDYFNICPHTINTLIRLIYQINDKQVYKFAFEIFKNKNINKDVIIPLDTEIFDSENVRYMLEVYIKDVLNNNDNDKIPSNFTKAVTNMIEDLDDHQYEKFLYNLFMDMSIDEIIAESGLPYCSNDKELDINKMRTNPEFCISLLFM